jgi:hypothetical protein
MDVEQTNPPDPDTLNMFNIASACEIIVIDRLVKIGYAVDLNDDSEVKRLGLTLAEKRDDMGRRQIRMEMEREFVPITGYLDGIMPSGNPLEVKSTRSMQVERRLSMGYPPNENYLYQLACYMDFLGQDRGLLVTISRPNGTMYFTELIHLGEGIYRTGDQSGCASATEEDDIDDEDFVKPVNEISTEGKEFQFDLYEEFKKWRKLMENNIIMRKEPPLDYEYRATVNADLLKHYVMESGDCIKIKNAIKGKRVLSSHTWQPQYCSWKNLWIAREMEQKGFSDMEKFCAYTEDEIKIMMDYCGLEWRITKTGANAGQRKLFKKKESK